MFPSQGPEVAEALASPAPDVTVEAALEDERRAATRSAARIRVAGSTLLLVLILSLAFSTGLQHVQASVAALALHAFASVVFFLVTERSIAGRVAWLAALVDIAAVGVVQVEAMSHATDPQSVAGYSLGVFALIIGLNMQTLRPEAAWAAKVEAVGFLAWLLASSGSGWVQVVAECLVLVLLAGSHRQSLRRLRELLRGLVDAQVSATLERRRGDGLASDKKLVEALLSDAKDRNDQLLALQREKETLAQVLVHDLRTPLAAVIGNVDWIRETLLAEGTHPQLTEAAGDALQRAHRLTAMISDLLDMARLEEGRLTPRREKLRVVHLCEEVRLQAMQTARGRLVALSVDVAEGLEVEADRELLRRILENLVSNALRFTQQRVHLSVRIEAGQAVFGVHNDGPVIEPAARDRLFQKFQQGGSSYAGWGLGLYFCRLAAEVHDGRIRLGDYPAWNVTFELSLPGGRLPVPSAA